MFKKLFFILVMFVFSSIIIGLELEINQDNIEQNNVDSAFENLVKFEVKKSVVFEDFMKSLSAETNSEFKSYIEKIEQILLKNNELNEIIKQYNDLFVKLKIIKKSRLWQKNLTTIFLIFAFDKENWTDMVKQEELDIDILKNALSEDQVRQISEGIISMSASLENVEKTVFAELDNSNLLKAFNEVKGNQKIRIGLILI